MFQVYVNIRLSQKTQKLFLKLRYWFRKIKYKTRLNRINKTYSNVQL